MNVSSGSQNAVHQIIQRGGVARDLRVKLQSFADRHYGHTVDSYLPTDNNLVSSTCPSGMDIDAFRYEANSRGIDKNLIRLPPIYHLGITGHQANSRFSCRLPHRYDDLPKILHGGPFPQKKPRRKKKRTCPAHCNIVHSTIHSEPADIAPRKK